MKYLFFSILMCFQLTSYSQSGGPVAVTPAMEKTFRQQIEAEVKKLRAKLEATSETDLGIEYEIDKFRVDEFLKKYMEKDYSTYGMNTASYKAAEAYDSLMNKYYKKLLGILQGDDKKALIKAQKAWIAFRDGENELVLILGKDEYAGGGTIQTTLAAAAYLEFVRKRTDDIVQHLRRGTQDYN